MVPARKTAEASAGRKNVTTWTCLSHGGRYLSRTTQILLLRTCRRVWDGDTGTIRLTRSSLERVIERNLQQRHPIRGFRSTQIVMVVDGIGSAVGGWTW